MKHMKQIEGVGAIICEGEKKFGTGRGLVESSVWWEFPGGKVEEGESSEEALRREIREELATDITVGDLFTTVECDYPKFHLTMHCYICSINQGSLSLLEHEAAKWLTCSTLNSVKRLPADNCSCGDVVSCFHLMT